MLLIVDVVSILLLCIIYLLLLVWIFDIDVTTASDRVKTNLTFIVIALAAITYFTILIIFF